MLTLKGQQGKTVVVGGASIKLIKQGCVLAQVREKTLPIRHVVAVEVRKPGGVFTGFIRFATAEGGEIDGPSSGGTRDPARDENAVVFADLASYEVAMQIKAYVEDYDRSRKA